jgi:hypothetical protein
MRYCEVMETFGGSGFRVRGSMVSYTYWIEICVCPECCHLSDNPIGPRSSCPIRLDLLPWDSSKRVLQNNNFVKFQTIVLNVEIGHFHTLSTIGPDAWFPDIEYHIPPSA